MSETHELLTSYAASRSEETFQELVNRYIDLVYSTALRAVNWDAHAAEDVTQKVFVDLAKFAGSIPGNVMVGGWLHRHTCFLARKFIRTETRRKAREQLAMDLRECEAEGEPDLRSIGPDLDDAINRLKAEDRQAILLRFFEQHDFGALGRLMGTSEEAARKRVHRALEKLRILLERRDVTLSATALGTLLAAKAVSAAPAGLAAAIGVGAFSTAACGGGTATILLHIMTMTKTQIGIIAAIALAATIPVAFQQHQKGQLRQEIETLRAQADQVAALTRENERLSNQLAQSSQTLNADPVRNLDELHKLRGEVGVLRKSLNEAASTPPPSTESPLSGLTQNPDMLKTLRDQQKIGLSTIYKGLAKQANLAPDKLEQLSNLLADDVMTNINHITVGLREGKQPEEMESLFAQQEAELQTKVKQLLGEEGLDRFKDYNRKLLSFLTAEQFKAMLPGDKENKETVAKQIFETMQDETQKTLAQMGVGPDFQLVPTLNFRNFASDAEAEKNLQLLDAVYEQAQARLAASLKPEDLEKFGEFRKLAVNGNRMALAINRKLMAPPGK